MYEQLIAKGYPEWLAKLIHEAGESELTPTLIEESQEEVRHE